MYANGVSSSTTLTTRYPNANAERKLPRSSNKPVSVSLGYFTTTSTTTLSTTSNTRHDKGDDDDDYNGRRRGVQRGERKKRAQDT